MIPLDLIPSILAWEMRLFAFLFRRVIALIFAPLVFAWWAALSWAEHPSAWRKASSMKRLTILAATAFSCVAVAVTHDELVALLWPVRWPATPIAVVAWWSALVPSAVIVARLRVRGRGNALVAGQVDPSRADVIRSAAWEAELEDLSVAAGVDVLPLRDDDHGHLRTHVRQPAQRGL